MMAKSREPPPPPKYLPNGQDFASFLVSATGADEPPEPSRGSAHTPRYELDPAGQRMRDVDVANAVAAAKQDDEIMELGVRRDTTRRR